MWFNVSSNTLQLVTITRLECCNRGDISYYTKQLTLRILIEFSDSCQVFVSIMDGRKLDSNRQKTQQDLQHQQQQNQDKQSILSCAY